MNFLELIPLPPKTGVNQGIHAPSAAFLEQLLGMPRDSFTGDCQPPNNPSFKRLVTMANVGPMKVTGLKPAVKSLSEIFTDVKQSFPELHDMLKSNGMLCCRFRHIHGKNVPPPSSHSWGTALDVLVGGKTDVQGDNKVLRGLSILAKVFNAHQWVWGATFPQEDAMHFEVSQELLLRWKDMGLLAG
jgi:D-alanyl-D-alanine carboxypeptidase